jgi:hypothetical protein
MVSKRSASKRKKINPHFWVFCEGKQKKHMFVFCVQNIEFPLKLRLKLLGIK